MDLLTFIVVALRLILSLILLAVINFTLPHGLYNGIYRPAAAFRWVNSVSSFVNWLAAACWMAVVNLFPPFGLIFLTELVWPFGLLSFLILFSLTSGLFRYLKARIFN